jgi:hypothetical protein
MNEREFLREMVLAMQELGIRYFITGGMAAIAYGELRFTSDVDVAAELRLADIPRLLARFSASEYYLSETAMRDAISRASQFNILHPASGNKLDVMVLSGSEHDRLRMQRRRKLELEPTLSPYFAAPEDVILKKLQYYQMGGSEKHLRDIASMLLIQRDNIDQKSITEWAAKLGVAEEWAWVRNRVDEANT